MRLKDYKLVSKVDFSGDYNYFFPVQSWERQQFVNWLAPCNLQLAARQSHIYCIFFFLVLLAMSMACESCWVPFWPTRWPATSCRRSAAICSHWRPSRCCAGRGRGRWFMLPYCPVTAGGDWILAIVGDTSDFGNESVCWHWWFFTFIACIQLFGAICCNCFLFFRFFLHLSCTPPQARSHKYLAI